MIRLKSLLLLTFCILMISNTLWADQLSGLPKLKVPGNNPQSEEKIALGHLLFNDTRFSGDGTISCASCHQEQKAFTDGLPKAKGINGQVGTRNAPTVINAAFFDLLFHDGRANSLEQQALGPFTNPIEHGLRSHDIIVKVVRKDPVYQKQFDVVFGIKPDAITIDYVVKAIAAYERSLVAADSAFDRYTFARDKNALSESAARGLRIFKRKGNCANCHEISWNNALFTDNRFYNLGVGFDKLEDDLDGILNTLSKDPRALATLNVLQRSELGRFNVTRQIDDIGKFKTPTLRNIALTAPYMHDGSMQTLKEVIEYYDKGGEKNPFLDPAIYPLHLTEQEKADLLNFLMALSSSRFLSKQ